MLELRSSVGIFASYFQPWQDCSVRQERIIQCKYISPTKPVITDDRRRSITSIRTEKAREVELGCLLSRNSC